MVDRDQIVSNQFPFITTVVQIKTLTKITLPVLDKSGGLLAIATRIFLKPPKNSVSWLVMRGGG